MTVSAETEVRETAREAAERERQPAARRQTARHEVVIVGGGNAGLSVAARLGRRGSRVSDVALIEPSEKHYYQPLWTLVGGGEFGKEASVKQQASLIPRGTNWIREAVAELRPHDNVIVTGTGDIVGYDFLALAPGIQIDWGRVPGLEESLGHNGVSSIWSYEHAETTWKFIRDFQGGTAVFTFPSTPIKCPGAAQKIMYLADDQFRRAGVRGRSRLIFASAAPRIFAVDKYARALERVIERKGIETMFRHNLVELRPQSKEAVFEEIDTGESVVLPFDFIHVAPPQSAPEFVKRSPLANADGWVEVDKHTLQHPRFPNVFSLGDASSLPTSKTGAAVRKQVPVLVENLRAAIAGKPLTARYDGYTACPLVTGYGRLILAEFDYDGTPRETFPFDQSKERRSMYLLKKRVLPALYWHGLVRGRA